MNSSQEPRNLERAFVTTAEYGAAVSMKPETVRRLLRAQKIVGEKFYGDWRIPFLTYAEQLAESKALHATSKAKAGDSK